MADCCASCESTATSARKAPRLELVDEILAHQGCGDLDCAICRSTATGHPRRRPTVESARAARAHARRAAMRRAARRGRLAPFAAERVRTGVLPVPFLRPELLERAKRMDIRAAKPDGLGDGEGDGDRTRSELSPGAAPAGAAPDVSFVADHVGPVPIGDTGLDAELLESLPVVDLDTIRGITCIEATDAAFDDDGFAAVGCHVGDLDTVDALVKDYMQANRMPNGSLAIVAPDGRLVLARGYTLRTAFPTEADVLIATPGSQFRVASISKPLTATAVVIADANRVLSLGDSVRDYFEPEELTDAVNPEWVEQTTLLHLLCHTSGLSRDYEGVSTAYKASIEHPIYQDARMAAAYLPAPQLTMPINNTRRFKYVSAWRGATDKAPYPLTGAWLFEPGSAFDYSNLGYVLLAECLARASGTAFENYLQDEVLTPLSMTATGQGSSQSRMSSEVEYWALHHLGDSQCWPAGLPLIRPPTQRMAYSTRAGLVTPGAWWIGRDCVEVTSGGFNLENMLGAGRVVSTAIDLCRFGWQFSGASTPTLMSEWRRDLMLVDWAGMLVAEAGRSTSRQYGLGWNLDASRYGTGWGTVAYHGGTLSYVDNQPMAQSGGTTALMFVIPTSRNRERTDVAGAVVAFVFNGNEADETTFSRSTLATGIVDALETRGSTGAASLWDRFA